MKLKTINIALTLALFLNLTCLGQKNIRIPSDFVESEPPRYPSQEWLILNHSQNAFQVEVSSGQLKISKAQITNKCELKTSTGWLRGIDNGEWGGNLTFYPTDTTKKKVGIKGENIKFIFNYKKKIYFIEELEQNGINGGALYVLDTLNNKYKYNKILDFEDAPCAFTIYNDQFLIATYVSFYIIKDFKKELVLNKTFWEWGLYPSSIAAFDDKNIFIGIRGGIVRVDLTEKNLKFYKYKYNK